MAKCWYFEMPDEHQSDDTFDPRATNQGGNVRKVSWSTLARLNIKYWNLEVENYQKFNTFSLIKKRHKLGHEFKRTLSDEAEYLSAEHMHEVDEVRFVLEGELYYDIFDNNKHLIRMHLVPGDMLLIPSYHFHRVLLPKHVKSATFLQLTGKSSDLRPMKRIRRQSTKTEQKQDSGNDNDDNNTDEQETQPLQDVEKDIKTYFMQEVERNPKRFINVMMQSGRLRMGSTISDEEYKDIKPDVNGIGYVMGGRASALASYPHLREFNGMLFVSGTSSRRPDNTHIGATRIDGDQWELDIRKQTRAVLENIKVILGTVGAGIEHLLALTVFLVDFKDYAGMNEVYNEYFDGETGPTRTTVAVARLPHPNLLIEIQCTAAKPTDE